MTFCREHFTMLLMIVVIPLSGCGVLGISTDKADPVSYNQTDFGPVSADSRIPFELPPFPDPSFESIIEQYKREVDANIGHPYHLQEKRKVIADPTRLWDPHGGVSPFDIPCLAIYWDTATVHWVNHGYYPGKPHKNMVMFLKHKSIFESPYRSRSQLYVDGVPAHLMVPQYFLGKTFYTTKDQEKRIEHLSHSGIDTSSAEYHRKKWAILAERVDPLLIAKHWSTVKTFFEKYGDTRYREEYTVGLDFAERVMRENPCSLEAMYYWANCLPNEQQMMGYQRILKKFPNAAFAHERIAHLFFEKGDIDAAQSHIQKAMQLDSRRAKNQALLAQCYAKRCEWEKAVAAYQSSEWLYIEQLHDLLHAQQQFLRDKSDRQGTPTRE